MPLSRFRGESAQLLLSPTRSVDLAEQQLRELPTGGRTPLPHALSVALETLEKTHDMPPLLVCSATVRPMLPDRWRRSLAGIAKICGITCRTQRTRFSAGYRNRLFTLRESSTIGGSLGAEYLTLEELSAENLALTIRGCIK